MNKVFKKTSLFLFKKQEDILSAAVIIMTAVFTSRLLGLVRDRMLTSRFSTEELGVYFASFRLPNLIFELQVLGAVSTAFIPVFTAFLAKKEKLEAFKVTSSVINLSVLVFAFISIPVLLFTDQVSRFIAPGFDNTQVKLMISFTRIMIVAQVFPLIIGNFLTGILQSFKNFLIPALAPIVYNIGIIFGILFFSPFFGLYGVVYGVVLGAILFMLVQIPLVLFIGYRHQLTADIYHPGVRKIGKLMVPRTLGLAVSQIDTTVDLMLSSLLGAKAVSVFNFAQHLQQLPVGLFGATIAQAALPSMAQKSDPADQSEFKKIFLNSFHQILFLTLPASVILIVLRIPAVRLVFGAARFDWEATVLTGKTVAFFSLSLFAQGLIHLAVRGFYALHDTKTPVAIGALAVFLNTFLSIFFVRYYNLPVWSLGLSTSIASILNAFLLLLFLDKKVGRFDRFKLFFPTTKIFIASLVTGFFLYIPMKLLDRLVFDTTRTLSLLFLTGIATFVGLSVYIFLAWFLNIKEVKTFINLIKRLKALRQIFFETSTEVINGSESKV